MSISFSCHCEERRKPAAERQWVVVQRGCNHSAFSGYQYTPSAYSDLRCLVCGKCGRTKAKYVDEIRDQRPSDPYP